MLRSERPGWQVTKYCGVRLDVPLPVIDDLSAFRAAASRTGGIAGGGQRVQGGIGVA